MRGYALGWTVNPEPPFSVVPPAGSAPARKSVRVLIADDDRDNANMLAVVLREGHEAVVALRGDEALDMSGLDPYLVKPYDLTHVLGPIRGSQDASSGKSTKEAR